MVGSPATTFLGVSPPVRGGFFGGAANPLAHDASWKGTAYSASHTNLQALRQLDSTGPISFLRSGPSGDARLLLGSPLETAALAEEAEASWDEPIEMDSPALVPPSRMECNAQAAAAAAPFSCQAQYFAV